MWVEMLIGEAELNDRGQLRVVVFVVFIFGKILRRRVVVVAYFRVVDTPECVLVFSTMKDEEKKPEIKRSTANVSENVVVDIVTASFGLFLIVEMLLE